MNRSTLVRRALIGLLVVVLLASFGAPFASAQDGTSRTLTDALGRAVTLDAPPQRIVALSASIVELLFAIGVTPAGVTEGIENPAAAGIPTIGTGYQPDLEAVAALEPDLIIANAQLQAQLADQLTAIAPTFFVMTMTAADVPANVRQLGQVTWHETSAEYLAASYDHFLALAKTAAAGKEGPSILIIVGMLQMPNYGKSATYLGDMAAMLGATNIADGEADAGPFPGYAQLSIEKILDADPDVILTITRGMPGAPLIIDEIGKDPVWSELSAVKNGRVYELDNRLYLEAPGPRFTEALLGLYNTLYGGME